MLNFWETLPRPFVGLAPMDGLTDQPLRQIVKQYGNPDVVFTEFVNVEGLCHNAERLLAPLLYDATQQPIVAQLYGKTVESFRQAAILVAQLGFAGIDINMGCPSKSVAGGGAGAGLIKTPALAGEIITAVKQGIADWSNGATCADCADFSEKFCVLLEQQRLQTGLTPITKLTTHQSIPVSVKTRLGYDEPELATWIKFLLGCEISTLTVHGRTYRQSYSGLANWELIGEIAELGAHLNPDLKIIGNGDVKSRLQGEELAQKYNLAGVLIGRAVQGNPFVFAQDKKFSNLNAEQQSQVLAKVALEHALIFEKTFVSQHKNLFLPMRKHLAWYMKGMPQAKEIRKKLVRTNNSQEVKQILQEFELL